MANQIWRRLDMTSTTYSCEDGTKFEVEWCHETDPDYVWTRDDYHFPLPTPPLEVEFQRMTVDVRRQVFASLNLEPPLIFNHYLYAHGFEYSRMNPDARAGLANPDHQSATIRQLLV